MDDDRYGRLQPAGEQWQLVFTRRLPHPPEKVWRAITEAEHVSAWFPADIVGDRRAGAPLQFVFREEEGPELPGEMRIFEPVELLEFTWSDEVMRFELSADGDGGTVLRFVNTFGDVGKAARDAAGWHACLDALDSDLDGTAPPERRWDEVHPHYVERFPAVASTVGPPEGHS